MNPLSPLFPHQTTPPTPRHRCRGGCRARVYRHTTEVGFHVQIDVAPLNPLLNPRRFIDDWQAWEWHGPHVRWVQLYPGQARTGRSLHLEHVCPPARSTVAKGRTVA